MSEMILLPVDGSEAANKAVELLARYGGERAAIAISVLNVQEAPAWARPHCERAGKPSSNARGPLCRLPDSKPKHPCASASPPKRSCTKPR